VWVVALVLPLVFPSPLAPSSALFQLHHHRPLDLLPYSVSYSRPLPTAANVERRITLLRLLSPVCRPPFTPCQSPSLADAPLPPPSTKKIKSELVAIEHGEKETTNIIFIQTHNYSYNNKYCHHCYYCRTNTVIPEHFPPCRTKRSSIRLESQQQSPSPSQTFPLHRLCRLNICTPNTRSFRSNTNLHLP